MSAYQVVVVVAVVVVVVVVVAAAAAAAAAVVVVGIRFLINVHVQGHHPHQWAPFQVTD